jgi:AsmA protein
MRTPRILAGIVGGLAALAVATVVAVWLSVNPNAYKAKLVASVQESTGRELSLPGDVKLALFPRVALELGPASLGNPPGFGDEAFLTFRHATVRVKLWPLLHERLELAGVEIDGMDLRLKRNAEGIGNWETAARPPMASPPLSGSSGGDIGHSLRNLAGIRVTHGSITYEDVAITKLQLEFGAITQDGVVPITSAFDADLGSSGPHASVNGSFAVSADSAGRHVRVAAISLSGLASRPGGNQPTHWEMSAPAIDVNLEEHAVDAPAFALRYLGAQVNGDLKAKRIADDWGATGSVTMAPLLLREFLPRLGVVVPRIQDPHALSELTAKSDFAYDAGGWHFNQIKAHLDDTQIHGSVAVLTGDERSVKFDLAADQIDADRYLKPKDGAGDADGQRQAIAMNQSTDSATNRGAKMQEVDGILSVASLHVMHMDFTSVKVNIDAKDDVVHLFPAQALIDGGRYSGDITYDRHGDIPSLSLDEHLAEVDMHRLLGDAAGGNRLSGRGTVSLKASAQGSGADAMLKSLNGHLEASLADGAIEGVDLSHEFGIAQALLARTSASTGADTRRTQFDTFRLSADIANGVATTKDLTIASQALRVTGQGSTNLSNKAVNFQLLASISTPTAAIDNIPLLITGTYADPKVRPDLDKLVKGELKQRLQDVVRDKLQGLFGKP